jgi:hypothetical protein
MTAPAVDVGVERALRDVARMLTMALILLGFVVAT